MNHEIDIPDGFDAINVETNENKIILNLTNSNSKLKENDIATFSYCKGLFIGIFKEHLATNRAKFKCCLIVNNFNLEAKEISYSFESINIANKEEKQLLFDKLKDKCLMFDGENIVRWRAEERDCYYCLSASRINKRTDDRFLSDNENYSIGNYFPTRKIADRFQNVFVESLENFHKNL